MSATGVCRLTGEPLEVVLDLGRQPLGNGFLTDPSQFPDEYFYSLACGFAPTSALFQIIEQPEPARMFHEGYAFQSGTSRAMSAHFARFADHLANELLAGDPDPFVVEIGSNDGILLKHFAARGTRHLGVEPSGNVADIAEEHGVRVLREFFSEHAAAEIAEINGQASVIVAANALCHIPDLPGVARAVDLLLAEDGFLVFEDPYLGDVIEIGSYDQIYDEHVFLFSALSVQSAFQQVGLELVDLTPLRTHGGSMRYTLARRGRQTPSSRVLDILQRERDMGLDRTETYARFAHRVQESAKDLRELLQRCAEEGEDVVGYGATSKSTTIYNYAGIGPDLVRGIYDSSPAKQHTFSPGMHIPILPESNFSESPARLAFLGAWNHEVEIREKNRAFEVGGGRWITHVPKVRIIGG